MRSMTSVNADARVRVVGARALVVVALAVLLAVAMTGVSHAAFGIQQFDGAVTKDATGTPEQQAGAHPFEASTTIVFNQTGDPLSGDPIPDGSLRNLSVDLPPGFVGNPMAAPKCTEQDARVFACPRVTQVGNAVVKLGGVFPSELDYAIYNLEPPPGVPAAFGFHVADIWVKLNAEVRSGGDYGLTITTRGASQAEPIVSTKVSFWGVPADAAHDTLRDYCPIVGGLCPSGAQRTAFLSNPTDCTAGPAETKLTAEAWNGTVATSSFFTHQPGDPDARIALTGCDRVPFAPTLTATPSNPVAGAPSGYAFDLHVPQGDNPEGLAAAHLRRTQVTLPAGVRISPSAADGLAGCSDAQIALKSTDDPTCPKGAKVGTVQVFTPLLDTPLTGSIFLGTQASDDPASGQMFRMFLLVQDKARGVTIKLPGSVVPDPATGQLTAIFDNNPQLPFSTLHLEFKDGPRAVLVNPPSCGTFHTNATLSSWSGKTVSSDSSFAITQNCDATGRFTPSLDTGLVNARAGSSSPFTLTLSRPDGQQNISGVDVAMAPGVLGNVGAVAICADAQAAAGTCSPESRVGHVMALAGAGSAPLVVPQPGKASTAVYLAGPYKGAPYSLSIVVPAQAGPFDLGIVVVRAALLIDPIDAHVSVQSDPIPTILKGVPLGVQKINVTLDRPGFMVSPTNCDPQQLLGRVSSDQGSVASVDGRLQVGDCAALKLAPKLDLQLTGKGQTTDGKHPGVSATLRQPAAGANLRKVEVTLPLSLALDPDNAASDGLCSFEAGSKPNPVCPASSVVGQATAVSPILHEPLSGPVYFVKNERKDPKSGRSIKTTPKLVIPLVGENGLKLTLTGVSSVPDNEHLVTTFNNIPDAPVSSFKLNINGGRKGILVVSGTDICKATQVAQQEATGQNGKVVDVDVPMSTPCALAVVASSHTPTSLNVTVGGVGAGRVSVSGAGLVKAARKIATATTATLQPRLGKAAKRALAHGRNVRMRVTVSFTPIGAKKARTVRKTLTVHARTR
jgi:hypothetical protein